MTTPAAASIKRTDRTRLRRYAVRANYDRATIYSILDEALVCHMGFTVGEQTYVIPTLCARVDDCLYVHGSSASRAIRSMGSGASVCVTATLIDGIVMARSGFFHSINYRSVVVLGPAQAIDEPAEKELALERFVERLVEGRWKDVRAPTRKELKATNILRMPLNEASAKTRNGPPIDPPDDLERDTWAGVIPLELRALAPVADPKLRSGIPTPEYAINYTRRRGSHPLLEQAPPKDRE
jgi:uncharacterized protein